MTGFYLVLSGNQVATQRSFIMIALVLLGVMFDRPTLTMRTLTVAAMLVLLFAPESVVHPSFQMSFAATLALIAGYERGALKLRANAEGLLGARVALWGVNEIVGLTVASLLAGAATTPYAAFHFHRIAPHGVLANLLAMPIVSAWVMPMGILGVVTMPLGLDAEFLAADGVRHRVDGRCGIVGREPARRFRPGHAVRRRPAFTGDGGAPCRRFVKTLRWRRWRSPGPPGPRCRMR